MGIIYHWIDFNVYRTSPAIKRLCIHTAIDRDSAGQSCILNIMIYKP